MMLEVMARAYRPTPDVPLRAWLEANYRLPDEGADLPGPYRPEYVPALWGIMHALDVSRMVVTMKAAQIGWTYLLVGYLCKRIKVAPSAMIGLFPKDSAAREFSDEKFVPSVRATPAMAGTVDVSGSRKAGQRATFKSFPGGFMKLVGSNSVSNVKSTPAPLVLVEEPDDTNDNVGEQGDAIRLARERLKRWRRGQLVLGGTPSTKGLSRVEEFLDLSNKRVLPIRCHSCGETHVLAWRTCRGCRRMRARRRTWSMAARCPRRRCTCARCAVRRGMTGNDRRTCDRR
jgi:phage terminase large subunit GpA-like protein